MHLLIRCRHGPNLCRSPTKFHFYLIGVKDRHPNDDISMIQSLISRTSKESSFFFTVSEIPLSEIDSLLPVCESSTLCNDKMKKCKKDFDCKMQSWHSRLFVSDNLTGLRDIEVSSPGSRVVHLTPYNPLVVGSSRTFGVTVETECCYDGVELSVQDVAGNVKKCVAGVNPNVASQCQINVVTFLVLLFATFKMK